VATVARTNNGSGDVSTATSITTSIRMGGDTICAIFS
jgi:hypothetical protein